MDTGRISINQALHLPEPARPASPPQIPHPAKSTASGENTGGADGAAAKEMSSEQPAAAPATTDTPVRGRVLDIWA